MAAAGVFFLYLLSLCRVFSPVSGVDFLLNSIKPGDLTLVRDARLEGSVVRLTNDSNQFSLGRAFYPAKLIMLRNSSGGAAAVSSFSTSFVFSVLPKDRSNPGFGIAFVLSATTAVPGLTGQYFGLFSDNTTLVRAPLLAFREPDGNHVGIDLNFIESSVLAAAGYYRTGAAGGQEFVPVDMRSGRNVRAWVDFDGPRRLIEVTVAPVEVVQKPPRPLISYANPELTEYLSEKMFVGFSASKTQWVEAQRVLAWSLRDDGLPARDINTTGLPVFATAPPSSSSSPLKNLAAGLSGAAAALALGVGAFFFFHWRSRRRRRGGGEEDEMEEWEKEYWPHRFAYAELSAPAARSGVGGETAEVAVKCVSHDSKQGLKEFMAEISSMGRLRHKNLVHIKGWCRRGKQLILVYDFMPNGSLSRGGGATAGVEGRRRVLADVAEGLQYLHHGWDQVVLHRDVKSSNILLDDGMRGRLGDFGLAKLQQHGEAPSRTRVVGTLGYLAPELAREPAPTAASDVYSFGVVALEVACGRRPIEMAEDAEEDDFLLLEWVRSLYAGGRLLEAADPRLEGDYPPAEMELVLKLGMACCHPVPANRPSMKEVVALLLAAGGQPPLSSGR
ncbi:unnamed protein product [Spirodela intermedia]|uniref:non-specific serine/threonine protein kinase n=1 Tax=Spirodela intermedia TaxID=51605 RepID=A0A7I8JE19_SPIIN|nr:unnamed protein product [Spirodela intermedia]CAA6667995.1 unnamed protein product [Spirodela intermedia]